MTTETSTTRRLPQWLAIMLVCLAGLLLEVGYTRIVSFKLWYYYTYLVIGLSLLGIGSGGVLVAIWRPLRQAATEKIIALCSIWGAVSIVIGYSLIARLPINTVAIWDYGTGSSFKNFALLAFICFLLFATFIALGVIVSTLLGRAGEGVGRLYFADLLGAGLACFIAVPLISRFGPPTVISLAALVFALVGLLTIGGGTMRIVAGVVAAAVLATTLFTDALLPDVRTEQSKLLPEGSRGSTFHDWGPVFRVDVIQVPGADVRLLAHDGTYGSGIWPFDGDLDSLTRYDTDARSVPFDVLGDAPDNELIIGSAGGNEILASLHFGVEDIEGVELNPVTVGLLDDEFADFTGHLPEQPGVDITQGDGRTYLARTDTDYDLVWYVAPDSYAANNAASSGAFVLSESYLYTTEMVEETLEHLTDDGIMVVQFGELDFEGRPNRTSRYVATAREALERSGIDDASAHLMVGAHLTDDAGDLSTIMVKRTPFTEEEAAAFAESMEGLPTDDITVHAPGQEPADPNHIVSRLASGSAEEADQIVADNPRSIGPITDDAPFFWHFSEFDSVLGDIFHPLSPRDPEDVIGERVLLLLLALAMVFAAVFLLVPFVFVRKQWRALPSKGTSAVYFACLGLAFMFYEISMIQRLVLFLGYPTYSLTVTLASILVFTGLGALLSRRLVDRSKALPGLLGVLALLTVFYQVGLGPITDGLLSAGLAVRVLVTFLVLAPLGLCLGMFMPLGLGVISRLSPDHTEEYVAWGWAVNGFFSVIGSVLTTILAMSFGFRTVQVLALLVYAVAVVAFLRLRATAERSSDGEPASSELADEEAPVTVGAVPANPA